MIQPAAQRAFALEVVQKLRAADFEALWAGGCVRDELLGIAPKDHDVATSATPDQIRDVFGRRKTLAIGAAFGVITVLGPREAGQIEVATYRTDAAYSDGRHPDSVSFTDAEHDAQRRDFTINGLFFDPVAGQVVDYVGGQADIQGRTIRAIGDPRQRFNEDKLRLLRAVRFAATFNFTIEPATLHAIQEMAAEITTVSAERIGMEIRRMLVDPNRSGALKLLRGTKLLPHVLPEVADIDEASFAETLRILSALHEPSVSLCLAALLSTKYLVPIADNLGTPSLVPSGLLAARTSLLVPSVKHRLRFTNKESDRAAWLIQHLPFIEQAPSSYWPQLQRILVHDGARELLALQQAIAGPADPGLAFCRERLAWPPQRLNPPPLVNGSDLIRHGLAPGPDFSALLEKIRDAQLEGEIQSRDEAFAIADRLRQQNKSLP